MFKFQLSIRVGDNDDGLLKTPACKQISLPPNFTFNIRPPSTEPTSNQDDESKLLGQHPIPQGNF